MSWALLVSALLTVVGGVLGGVLGGVADHQHWVTHPSGFYLIGFTAGQLSRLAAEVVFIWRKTVKR